MVPAAQALLPVLNCPVGGCASPTCRLSMWSLPLAFPCLSLPFLVFIAAAFWSGPPSFEGIASHNEPEDRAFLPPKNHSAIPSVFFACLPAGRREESLFFTVGG